MSRKGNCWDNASMESFFSHLKTECFNLELQSLIAICNKLIRILFTIGTKQCEFSEERMLKDIPYLAPLQNAV